MKTACLIGSAGISRHGDQQRQSCKSAFQHHGHSVGTRTATREGNRGSRLCLPIEQRPTPFDALRGNQSGAVGLSFAPTNEDMR